MENKEKRMCMKKLFLLALVAIITVVFLSCSSDGDDGKESTVTTLTVKNASSYVLFSVKWEGVDISDEEGYMDFVGILPGYSVTRSVSEGFGNIYFWFYPQDSYESMSCYTADIVQIYKGDAALFTFTNNTVVVQLDDYENKMALGRIKFRTTTTLSIKNNSSYDLIDTVGQTYTFSSNLLYSVLENGAEIANDVNAGYGYVYFAGHHGHCTAVDHL